VEFWRSAEERTAALYSAVRFSQFAQVFSASYGTIVGQLEAEFQGGGNSPGVYGHSIRLLHQRYGRADTGRADISDSGSTGAYDLLRA